MSQRAEPRWPRPYILQLHQRAIDEGCCRVEGVDAATAKSLIAAFYRIRKRGDSAHKLMFIPEEYHLVTAYFEPQRSSILFLFDSVPDDMALPKIVSVAAGERIGLVERLAAAASPVEPAAADELDISAAINALVEESESKQGKGEPL